MLLGTSDVDTNIPETRIVQNKTFAIIIANEQYYNEKNVQFAYNDGPIFKEYCTKTFGLPSSMEKHWSLPEAWYLDHV